MTHARSPIVLQLLQERFHQLTYRLDDSSFVYRLVGRGYLFPPPHTHSHTHTHLLELQFAIFISVKKKPHSLSNLGHSSLLYKLCIIPVVTPMKIRNYSKITKQGQYEALVLLVFLTPVKKTWALKRDLPSDRLATAAPPASLECLILKSNRPTRFIGHTLLAPVDTEIPVYR